MALVGRSGKPHRLQHFRQQEEQKYAAPHSSGMSRAGAGSSPVNTDEQQDDLEEQTRSQTGERSTWSPINSEGTLSGPSTSPPTTTVEGSIASHVSSNEEPASLAALIAWLNQDGAGVLRRLVGCGMGLAVWVDVNAWNIANEYWVLFCNPANCFSKS